MNIEKTIEEKAREFLSLTAINEICQYVYEGNITIDEAENCIETASIESFKAGAAFALSLNRWRKVSEELPEDNMIIIAKGDNDDFQDMFLIKIKSDYDMSVLTSCYTEWKPII